MEALAENRKLYRESDARMGRRVNPNMRQLLEGMTLTFDAHAAGDARATIQFVVGAPQIGNYFLEIADGVCTFHTGMADSPTLTISTPSDVWLKIANGELNPQQALMQGMYKASGDFGLLLKMGTWFKSTGNVSWIAPREQRPSGPIALSGMAWMSVAFVPTILYWVLFNLPINPWVSVGLPLLLSLAIVVYRTIYDRPTWLEVGICLFFVFVAGLHVVGVPGLARWGSVLASLTMSGIWLSPLLFSGMPVSGEYSKWGLATALWRLSLFIHPNAVISLMWGWQFIAAGALGMTAIWLSNLHMPLIVAQYGLIVPASWFTTWYQKDIRSHPISDVDKAMAQIRLLAAIGLVVVFVMTLVTWLWL